jgi:hypothetical protein
MPDSFCLGYGGTKNERLSILALADFLDGLEITHFNSQTHLLFKLYLCKNGAAKEGFQLLAMRIW